jgi:hypothetical protein
MRGYYGDRRDHFASLTKRNFRNSLIRLLEEEYKIIGSHRILEMLADDIESLQSEFYPPHKRLRPGMICWVTTKRTTRKPSYGKRTEDYKTVTVYLPLITQEDINRRVYVRDGDRNAYYERCKERDIATMVRIIRAAWEQMGMLCQAEIAVLLNRALTTVRKYLAEYEAQHPEEALPLKGYILDQGSRPTHKGIILTLYEQGIDPTDIANRTNHGLDSVDRYIKTYNRVKELSRKEMSREEIKKVTGIALRTIDAYLKIAMHFHPEIKEMCQNNTKKQ